VATLERDSFRLAITPELFEAHLRVITECGRPARAGDLIRAVRSGKRLAGGVVVTLDDGYADNLSTAKPLLERYQIPASVYITSGYVGAGREFWWDTLERLLLEPATLPPTLDLPVPDSGTTWTLDPAACESHDEAARLKLLRSVRAALLASPGRIDETLDALCSAIGIDTAPRETHRVCTEDEVRELVQGGAIEVGAHARTHPRLSSLSEGEQREEIHGSKQDLERMLGSTVTEFAYPFGFAGDYTVQTARIVEEAGFTGAFTLESGIVTSTGIDPFEIPRLVVHHRTPADELKRTLRWLALG
jgi:peptidoglycan/xylan/chitin deacetylase (PgdA/CDA1 family)